METTENIKEKPCPLCIISSQEVLADFPRWRISRTKTMKGHRERLMIYCKNHKKKIDEQSIGEAHILLYAIGQKSFAYAKERGIFEPIFATVPDHWHRVASDIDPRADDYDQILKTPRLVVDNQLVTIDRITANSLKGASEASGLATEQGTITPTISIGRLEK